MSELLKLRSTQALSDDSIHAIIKSLKSLLECLNFTQHTDHEGVLWPIVEQIFEQAFKYYKRDNLKEQSIHLLIVIV